MWGRRARLRGPPSRLSPLRRDILRTGSGAKDGSHGFKIRPTALYGPVGRERPDPSPEPPLTVGTILAGGRFLAMSWFKISRGGLRFRGRITKQPFVVWIATPQGIEAVDAAARELRFCMLGRTRTARRQMWRELRAAVDSEPVRAVLAAEPDRFLAIWTELAYAPALPRISVALRRLVVVPRTMIAARAVAALSARLMAIPEFAVLDEPVRTFFCRRVVWEMDDAIVRAKPSTHRPVATRDSWACVTLDQRFVWVDPLWSGRDWLGHIVLFEMPAEGATRRQRREIESAIEQLQNTLPTLSPVQRDGTVRSASSGLQPIRV